MSGYTKFAVVGAGSIGSYIIQQLLKDKAAGVVKEVSSLLARYSGHPIISLYDVLNTPLAVVIIRAPRPQSKAMPR